MAITSILGTAVSGLRDASRRAEVAANNIVNVNTPGYQAARVQSASIVVGSGDTARNAGVQAVLAVGGNVDLAQEFVNLTQAKIAFQANVETIRTAEELLQEQLRTTRDGVDIKA